jgi:hypothetical protein
MPGWSQRMAELYWLLLPAAYHAADEEIATRVIRVLDLDRSG